MVTNKRGTSFPVTTACSYTPPDTLDIDRTTNNNRFLKTSNGAALTLEIDLTGLHYSNNDNILFHI